MVRGLRRLGEAWVARHGIQVVGGQMLLVVTGAITVLTLPLFHPDAAAWLTVGIVSEAMLVVLVVSEFLPWRRLPRRFALIFPTSVALALAAIGLETTNIASAYAGLFILCFTHIGLTQRPWTSVAAVPVGILAWICTYGGWHPQLIPRLLIAVLIWALLGELLAQLMRRQRVLSRQLRRAAHTDSLTGIANRRDLTLRLSRVVVGDVIILVDLDHFKQLNDSHGHAVGDRVLADFGQALRAALREQDYPARYGGEEFAIHLPATSLEGAGTVLERLRHHWSLLQPEVTFSAGVVRCTPERDAIAALAAADSCLYAAKAAGRNTDRYEQSALATPPHAG